MRGYERPRRGYEGPRRATRGDKGLRGTTKGHEGPRVLTASPSTEESHHLGPCSTLALCNLCTERTKRLMHFGLNKQK
jgi:hypothetical protein